MGCEVRLGDIASVVGGVVVDDDHFEVDALRCNDGIESFVHQVGIVEQRHQHGHCWCRRLVGGCLDPFDVVGGPVAKEASGSVYLTLQVSLSADCVEDLRPQLRVGSECGQ